MATKYVRSVLLSAVLCVAGFSGCATSSHSYLDVLTVQPAAQAADPQCPRDGVGLGADSMSSGSGPRPGTLPSTFVPNRVRLCRLTGKTASAGQGRVRYTAKEETSAVTPQLLQALTLSDQQFDPRDNGSCDSSYHPSVYLLLIDRTNHAFRPRLPADPCGDPRHEVQVAVDGLAPSKVTNYTFVQAP